MTNFIVHLIDFALVLLVFCFFIKLLVGCHFGIVTREQKCVYLLHLANRRFNHGADDKAFRLYHQAMLLSNEGTALRAKALYGKASVLIMRGDFLAALDAVEAALYNRFNWQVDDNELSAVLDTVVKMLTSQLES